MRSSPYNQKKPSSGSQRAPPRKKACINCTKSKVRCNLEKPGCSRCQAQGRHCEYFASRVSRNASAGNSAPSTADYGTSISETTQIDPAPDMPIALAYTGVSATTWRPPNVPQIRSIGREHVKEYDLDLRAVDLVPGANAEDIRDRWLRPYILPPLGREEIFKVYNPFTLQYISRVLSTYPRCMLKDGGLPPIIHHGQIAGKEIPRALANCYTLVRMWEQAMPGSETMVVNTVEKEMQRLADEPPSQHDFELLAAFQAYLMYSIIMYFSPLRDTSVINDTTMMTLMELAFRTAQRGLFCAAELSHNRPTWESWIVVSAKRRSLLAMYLFSSVYNADRSLPNFIADEMRGVYAPESKTLWDAADHETWGKEYDRHILDWEDGMFEISELWRSPETGSPQRRKRVERWVQTVDEFGMTILAVCVHIHGS